MNCCLAQAKLEHALHKKIRETIRNVITREIWEECCSGHEANTLEVNPD